MTESWCETRAQFAPRCCALVLEVTFARDRVRRQTETAEYTRGIYHRERLTMHRLLPLMSVALDQFGSEVDRYSPQPRGRIFWTCPTHPSPGVVMADSIIARLWELSNWSRRCRRCLGRGAT